VNAARIVSGYGQCGAIVDRLAAFVFPHRDGETWREIPGARARDNVDADWYARFDSVTTAAVRLLIERSPGELARVWEVAPYDPPVE
jgi:hypothetical protein